MSQKNNSLAIFIVVALLIVGFVVGVSVGFTENGDDLDGIKQFNSTEQFENYTSNSGTGYDSGIPSVGFVAEADQASSGEDLSKSYSTRQTNVQVLGIDEPDKVKLTEGAAYYSPERRYYAISQPFATDVVPIEPPEVNRTTKVIDTDDTENPEIVNEIDKQGKILREDNTLILYNQEEIVGYDISKAEDPVKEWDKELPSRTDIVTARMTEGTVFFVLNTGQSDCPVKTVGNKNVSCENIYYPTDLKQGQGVYSAISVDSESGELESETSFVGSRESTVYMSGDNMYIAYTQSNSLFERFVEERLDKVNVSEDVKQQVAEIDADSIRNQYDLRRQVRGIVTGEERYSKRSQESIRITEAYHDFLGNNQRDAHRTVIMKLNIDDGTEVSPSVAKDIPGRPLNQYSFDERNGNLRVATTVQGYDESSQSLNDMYVLDDSLEIQGSVKNMAEGQRVYAVRFIGDKGYIITFRQIDPLHVINIDNPQEPEEVGVLELPGFSDYLHQVSEDEIMGIGESQDRKAKVVLFDVSDETEPVVSDSLVFNREYSTEISENYRAFLEDEEMGVYYIPAGQGVQVVEVNDGELNQKQLISTPSSSERVRIVGEDLYVFHSNGVMSVDRETYEVKKKLSFN